jgi:DNA-binding cell septation regulator SpoVG
MPTAVRVVAFTLASSWECRSGLLGYLVLELEGLLVLEAVTLRRTKSGTLLLSFPERIDAQGHRHPIVRPRNRAARHHIERAVLAQISISHPQLTEEHP